MPKGTVLRITQNQEDFVVEVTKFVAVPRAAVMQQSDPAQSLIDAVKANLGTALDTIGKEEAKDQIEILTGDGEREIKRRILSQKDQPADGKERPMF